MEDHRDEIDETGGGAAETEVRVDVQGLSIYTHHGVTAEEQRVGQRLELDVSLEIAACDAILTDRLDDTVDYAEVCDLVAFAATERSYRTLERLASVIADRLADRFSCRRISVRATKPAPPIPMPLGHVSVEVERYPDHDREAGGPGGET